jgi:hypothetical protein
MSRTEKPDEESWKTEVEKANRSTSKKTGGGTTARNAKAGKFVTGNGGASSKEQKSEKPKDGKS